jgi:hypothetical protein
MIRVLPMTIQSIGVQQIQYFKMEMRKAIAKMVKSFYGIYYTLLSYFSFSGTILIYAYIYVSTFIEIV